MDFIELSKNQFRLINNIKNSKSLRKKSQRFILEGTRSVFEGIMSDYSLDFIVVSKEFSNSNKAKMLKILKIVRPEKIFITKNKIFDKLSDTVTPQGIMAVLKIKTYHLEDIIKENFLILALDRISDPGNMGTIIRTADAVGVDGILLGKGCVDIYNPKVVRSTMGSIVHLPFVQCEKIEDTLIQLKKLGGKIITTHLEGEKYFYNIDFNTSTVIVLGKEDIGVSREILEITDEVVKIPMLGRAESLNVAIANGIVLYEAVRQRLDK